MNGFRWNCILYYGMYTVIYFTSHVILYGSEHCSIKSWVSLWSSTVEVGADWTRARRHISAGGAFASLVA